MSSSRQDRILAQLVNKATNSGMSSMHAACLVKGGKICHVMNNSTREFINGHRMSSTHAEIASIHHWLKKERRRGSQGTKGDPWGRYVGNTNQYWPRG